MAKLQAIIALGDLAMNSGEAFAVMYLDSVLRILESAAKMSLQTVRAEDDPDLSAYLNQLRDTLIDCYVTIVHGVGNSQAH